MKTKKFPSILIASLALLLIGLFLSYSVFFSSNTGDSASQTVNSSGQANREESPNKQTYTSFRDAKEIRFEDQYDGRSIALSMGEIALIDADGKQEIVKLNPPATPQTLEKRMSEYKAAQGVFPVAYLEDIEDTTAALRIVTRDIRVQMPQDQAEQFANKHGLQVKALPSYAKDWVVFSATRPLEAIEKIAGIRMDSTVQQADVLLAVQMVKMDLPNDPLVTQQWHLKTSSGAAINTDINVEDVWLYPIPSSGIRGRNIRIGIVDDGMQYTHPDLSPNADTINDYDWNGRDSNPAPNLVSDFHGTSCAGVAAARGNNSVGVSGVAPEATLIGLRLIAGPISDLTISEAMSWMPNYMHISSNSWGYPTSGEQLVSLSPLTKAAIVEGTTTGRNGRGTIYLFSAGNNATLLENSNYDEFKNSIYTIAVGAVDSDGKRSFYSERGANVVICAPSNGADLGITTADLVGGSGYNKATGVPGDYTDDFGGTSSATPAVSGTVALMLDANPNLGWRDVQDILIRSAFKIDPTSSEWITNGAGIEFNHNYGAGLVDAKEAVALSLDPTRANLRSQQSVKSTISRISQAIPNNTSSGTELEFDLSDSNLITEHATVRLSIDHSARGDLQIILESPEGTRSNLAEVRNDDNADYSNFTLSTVRNWGEESKGKWKLIVADRKNESNTTGGTITDAELIVYGTFKDNPPPVVRITDPDNNTEFSPNLGYDIKVSAVDLDIEGEEDDVAEVELYENDVLIGTRTAPGMDGNYTFTIPTTQPIGTYVYEAKATDSESLEATSDPVTIIVKNKTPIITAASISPNGVQFTDQELLVTVTASDPESTPIQYDYFWESSTNALTFAIDPTAPTATGSNLPTFTLPANTTNSSGKLWRCVITVTDGNTTSEQFRTAPVNLVAIPPEAVVGQQYLVPTIPTPSSYFTGLVLAPDILEINRPAIIHEFSQGPNGGSSEWIEILVLQTGSLRDWRISDDDSNTIFFRDSAVWDDIKAGTIILIYNGNTIKDKLIPADDTDKSDGRLIMSSSNLTFFTGTRWPNLNNTGDAINLFAVAPDDSPLLIHQLSYGNKDSALPYIGQVPADRAAFFAGNTDPGADVAGEWNLTNATKSRNSSFPQPNIFATALNIVQGVELVDGQYVQDFNVSPGPSGGDFPEGWAAFQTNLNFTQTFPLNVLRPFDGFGELSGAFNFGSSIGLYSANDSFDPSFIALGLNNTIDNTGLKVSYDLTKILDGTRVMQVELQYTFGNPNNTSSKWIRVPRSLYRSNSAATGVPVRFTNIALPSQINNRSEPVYLRWYYQTARRKGGVGGRDAIALDNVIISTDAAPNIVSTLTIKPSTFKENAGANAATATLTLSQTRTSDTVFSVLSTDESEVTVPQVVTIEAGDLSTTFQLTAVDDLLSDGPQSVTIAASHPDIREAVAPVIVADNEPVLNGVTPGFPNTSIGARFIERLINNLITEPGIFSIISGSLPPGLQLDPATGQIFGTVLPTATQPSYTFTVQVSNNLGGSVSHTYTIDMGASMSLASVGGRNVIPDSLAQGSEVDSDGDGFSDLFEYALGTSIDVAEQVSPLIFAQTDTELSVTYKKLKGRDDVTITPEWSESREDGSWQNTGFTIEVIKEDDVYQTIKATLPYSPPAPQKYIRLKAVMVTPP